MSKPRQSNIQILRILAMFMILVNPAAPYAHELI